MSQLYYGAIYDAISALSELPQSIKNDRSVSENQARVAILVDEQINAVNKMIQTAQTIVQDLKKFEQDIKVDEANAKLEETKLKSAMGASIGFFFIFSTDVYACR
jgi:hypothetical protein